MDTLTENTIGGRLSFRRKILINPKFQLKMIFFAIFLAALVVGVVWLANYIFFYRFFRMSPNFNYLLMQQREFMSRLFFVVAGTISFFLLLGGLAISHRIAGPVNKVCKRLRALNEGSDLSEIQFRKKDFFPELAEAYNYHLAHYRKLKGGG